MATLSGQTIANTFDSILHVEDDTAGLVATSTDSRVIQDGVGANSALALATDSVRVTSTNKLYINDVGDEYISGDATDLTIASGNDLNLTATTDINIPASVGLTFGHASNQKIEGDGTDLSIDATGNINVTSTVDEAASIYLHANAGTSETVKVHADQGTGAASLNLLSDAGGITLSAGNTSHGVIVGDISGAPVTIGHTTSETTVNDNLTVTGTLTSGAITSAAAFTLGSDSQFTECAKGIATIAASSTADIAVPNAPNLTFLLGFYKEDVNGNNSAVIGYVAIEDAAIQTSGLKEHHNLPGLAASSTSRTVVKVGNSSGEENVIHYTIYGVGKDNS